MIAHIHANRSCITTADTLCKPGVKITITNTLILTATICVPRKYSSATKKCPHHEHHGDDRQQSGQRNAAGGEHPRGNKRASDSCTQQPQQLAPHPTRLTVHTVCHIGATHKAQQRLARTKQDDELQHHVLWATPKSVTHANARTNANHACRQHQMPTSNFHPLSIHGKELTHHCRRRLREQS